MIFRLSVDAPRLHFKTLLSRPSFLFPTFANYPGDKRSSGVVWKKTIASVSSKANYPTLSQ